MSYFYFVHTDRSSRAIKPLSRSGTSTSSSADMSVYRSALYSAISLVLL